MESNDNLHGDPTSEYMRHKGIDKPRHLYESAEQPSMHDILCAILLSADSIHSELRKIRSALERQARDQ